MTKVNTIYSSTWNVVCINIKVIKVEFTSRDSTWDFGFEIYIQYWTDLFTNVLNIQLIVIE